MMRFVGFTLSLVGVGLLAGCGRVGLGDFGGAQPQARYEPLPAAPTKPVVTQGDLQPLPPVPGEQPAAGAPVPPPGDAVAGVPPALAAPAPASAEASAERAVAVGRTDLLGGWKIASGGDNCQLFMTLTTWSGGYRATTRGCNTPQLQKISAWDLSGKQVSLKGADGSTVATLYGAGAERFSGQTAERQSVTLSR
ncbi:AprI/Inh family metalloprotease inhibitor [Prosthecomicrobium sp. N25]|uniref:AprI/Inh family metalloprotease inhibitor n=1 Tax=Prosthecomicrobium sp. N25 TaxID=3129254 RepID=UPI0030773EA0